MTGHGPMPLPVKAAVRPVAFYTAEPHDGAIWLVRRSPTGSILVSPYTSHDFAQLAADHLNSLVRWEVPQQWAPTP